MLALVLALGWVGSASAGGWGAASVAVFHTSGTQTAAELNLGGGGHLAIDLVDTNAMVSPWRLVPVGARIADLGQVPIGQVETTASNISWHSDAGAEVGETYLVAVNHGPEVRLRLTALNTVATPPTGQMLYAVAASGTGGGATPTPGSNSTCEPLKVGPDLAVRGPGRMLLEAHGLAGGTLVTLDPKTGAVADSTTYAVDEVVRFDPATGATRAFRYIADEVPRLSPNGRAVVVRNFGWQVTDLGGRSVTYHGHLADVNWTAAAWSPDGRYLAYQGAGVNAQNDVLFSGMLYVLDLSTGNECVADTAGGVEDVAWLPRDRLVFSTASGLYEMASSMQAYHRLRIQTGAIDGGAFSVSPDGRLVVWSRLVGGHAVLWLATLDGSGSQRIVRDSANDLSPTFSPDGREVAFVRMAGAFPGELWLVAANGRGVWPARAQNHGLIAGIVSIDQWVGGSTADRWPSR